jgi:acetylglutamate kinase
MAPNRDVRETIVELLSNMSDGKEIRSYLQRFSEVDQSRFAVIKVGGAILKDRLEETAAALAFLHTVGLTPIVLHGGGPQLDAKLEAEGIGSEKIDGLRVTNEAVLDAAREIFTEQNIELVEEVRAQGVSAHSLTTGAFDAKFVDQERYGFVGEPTDVHLDLLRSIVSSGAIPILTCLGVAPGGQLVNMNADAATRLLVHAVQPMKIIFLVDSGGLLDADGDVIQSINLASDYEPLMEQDWVHSGMRLKLHEIRRLLDDSPPTTSVSITTPSGLARDRHTYRRPIERQPFSPRSRTSSISTNSPSTTALEAKDWRGRCGTRWPTTTPPSTGDHGQRTRSTPSMGRRPMARHGGGNGLSSGRARTTSLASATSSMW